MRPVTLCRSLLPAIAGLFLIASTGQADDRAAAHPLFDEGRRLMKAGKVAEACGKFEAASQLSATPGVRLNLAACWAKLGRTASAWGMYDEAAAIAERNGEGAAVDVAQRGKAELERRLSRLVVTVGAQAAVPGLVVTRDGEPVPSGAWGVGVPVDPGDHEIAARAPGYKAWSSKASVKGDGASVAVLVPPLEAEAPVAPPPVIPVVAPSPVNVAPPPVAAPPAEPPRDEPSGGSGQRAAGIVISGVGLAAIGAGAYFGVKTIDEKNDYQTHEVAGRCLDATCQSESHDATIKGNVSTGLFIGGGVLAVTGLIVALTAPHGREHDGNDARRTPRAGVSARLVPVTAPRTAGLSLEGSW